MRSDRPGAIRFLLRRNMFIGVGIFLLSFFLLPYWGLAQIPANYANVVKYYQPEHMAAELTRLVSQNVFLAQSQEMMVIIYGGMGFLCALLLVRHLFSRRQGMLHASLPVRREKDFLHRCIAFAVLGLAPVMINFLLYLVVVGVNGLWPYVNWGILLGKFGVLLLIQVYGFAMGMLSSVLTGTYWAALLAGAVLIVGFEGLSYLWFSLATRYLHTIVTSTFTDGLRQISPCFSLYKGFYQPAEFVWLPGALAIVLALGLSLLLWRVRRTEAAEKTLAFGWLHTVMGLILPVMGGSILGMVFYLSFYSELSLVAGMVAGAALTYWVCRVVFNQRFCGIVKQWYLPVAAAALMLLGVVVLHTDALGFDHFLPERSQLTAVTYRPQEYSTGDTITITTPETLDAAYDWCLLMRDEVDAYPNGIGANAESSSMVKVTYHLGDRQVHRMYPNKNVRNAAQPALREIIESDDYLRSIIAEACLDGEVESLYLSCNAIGVMHNQVRERFGADEFNLHAEHDAAQIRSLMTALQQDISTRTLAEMQQDSIYSLSVYARDPATGNFHYNTLPIYPGDVEFLRTAFAEQAEDIIDYVTGGFAADEDVVALKVTHAETRGMMDSMGVAYVDLVDTVTVASGPEEAAAWAKATQNISAHRYYYMPDYEDESSSQLILYSRQRITEQGHAIPEDLTMLYRQPDVPNLTRKNFIGQ